MPKARKTRLMVIRRVYTYGNAKFRARCRLCGNWAYSVLTYERAWQVTDQHLKMHKVEAEIRARREARKTESPALSGYSEERV